MNLFKYRDANVHYMICAFMFITLFICPGICFSANLNSVKRFLAGSELAQTWDMQIKKDASKSYADALEKSGKFTQAQLEEETTKIKKIFETHFSYNAIKPDLEECLTDSLSNADIDFLIKYDLKVIQQNSDNENIFLKKFENVNMCVRSVIRIKLTKLKESGLL